MKITLKRSAARVSSQCDGVLCAPMAATGRDRVQIHSTGSTWWALVHEVLSFDMLHMIDQHQDTSPCKDNAEDGYMLHVPALTAFVALSTQLCTSTIICAMLLTDWFTLLHTAAELVSPPLTEALPFTMPCTAISGSKKQTGMSQLWISSSAFRAFAAVA